MAACTFAPREAATDAATGTADADAAAIDADSPACATSPAGLVAWWRGDGDAADAMGSFPGVLAGDTSASAAGHVGNAFSFDGNGDQVTIATAPQSEAFTIEGWIEATQATGYRTIYATGPRGLWLLDGKLTWWQGGNRFISDEIVPAGFHHVAFTSNGTTLAGFIDGQPRGTASFTTASLPGSPVGIGGHDDNEYLTGRIDELSIYNRALLAGEIAAIAAAGAAGKCP